MSAIAARVLAPLFALGLWCGSLPTPAQADSSRPVVPAAGKFVAGNADGATAVPGKYLVQTTGSPTVDGGDRSSNLATQAEVAEAAQSAGADVERHYTAVWNGLTVTASKDEIEAVAAQPEVTAVYPVYRVTAPTPMAATTTSDTTTDTALSAIDATDLAHHGEGVKVGVIDTGIDYNHTAFGGSGVSGTKADFGTDGTSRVKYGWDFVGDSYTGSNSPVPDPDPDDCMGHGTHVAGIIGASADTDPAAAGIGVASQVTFGAYKIFGCDGSSDTDLVLQALTRAYKDGMDVVNLSLGTPLANWPDYPDAQAAAALVAKGMVVVAAAGNSGDAGLLSLGSVAAGNGVIAVAAADSGNQKVASYSGLGLAANLSLKPNLTAPGGSIYSTIPLDMSESVAKANYFGYAQQGFGTASGTSMATPFVTGAVAVMISANPSLRHSPAGIAKRLYVSAKPLTSRESGLTSRPEAVVRQGAGMLDLDKAMSAQVTVSPAVIALGDAAKKQVSVTVTNYGDTAKTYTVKRISAVSAAASNGSGRNAGTSTPDWGFAQVDVRNGTKKVTIQPGKAVTLKVWFRPPTGVFSGRNGVYYGGWLRFTDVDDSTDTVSVPFAGLRGDYQRVNVLHAATRSFTSGSTSNAWSLPCLGMGKTGALSPAGDKRTFAVSNQDYPAVLFHLDYPVSDIRVKLIDTKSKKGYYLPVTTGGSSTHLGEQPRDASYTYVRFLGYYVLNGRQVAAKAGRYQLQVRVLRPLGKASRPADWQSYTTVAFTVK